MGNNMDTNQPGSSLVRVHIVFASMIRSCLKCTRLISRHHFAGQNTGMCFNCKAINLNDLNVDWLIHHDFVMSNRKKALFPMTCRPHF